MKQQLQFVYILFSSILFCGNIFSQSVGIGSTQFVPTGMLEVRGTTTDNTAYGLRVRKSDATDILVVRNDGTVGIGTTAPTVLLTVRNSVAGVGSVLDLLNTDNTIGSGTGLLIGLYNNAGTPVEKFYGGFKAVIADNTAGSEDGTVAVREMVAGALLDIVTLNAGKVGLGNSASSPSSTLHVHSGLANTSAIETLENTAGNYQNFVTTATPNSVITGSIGDFANDVTNGVLYFKTSGTATNTGWTALNGVTGSGWNLTGNTGTSSVTNYIGTTDATDFVVRTAGTERMRVLAGGTIAIGTTLSTAPLTVYGSTDPDISVLSGSATLHASYGIGRTAREANWGIAGDNGGTGIGDYSAIATTGDVVMRVLNEDLVFSVANATKDIRFATGPLFGETEKLTIKNSGLIGIGTTSPAAGLHVKTAITAAAAVARGSIFEQALTAAANNDVLTGVRIAPTFTNGAFTGLSNIALDIVSDGGVVVVPRKSTVGNPATGTTNGAIYYNSNANKFMAYENSAWVQMIGSAAQWATNGNVGLTAGTNFLGTTDAVNLVLKANNVQAGYLDQTVTGKTFYGYEAGLATTGTSNTAMGYGALKANIAGAYNTVLGTEAGNKMKGASNNYNTLLGYRAGYNADGAGAGDVQFNTFIGAQAGLANTTGSTNTEIGVNAGMTNQTGVQNTYIGVNTGATATISNSTMVGYGAGYSTTTGPANTFLGTTSGFYNTSGQYNVYVGQNAGYGVSTFGTGNNNTFVGTSTGILARSGNGSVYMGFEAGYSNVTSDSIMAIGVLAGRANTATANTFIGTRAGFSNSSGTPNMFIGHNAGYYNSTANQNMAVGYMALYKNQTGIQNTAVGYNAGYNNLADNNTFIGWNAGYNVAGSASANGDLNTFVGFQSGYNVTTGRRNVCLGVQNMANFVPTAVTSIENTLIGYQAGTQITTGVGGNVFLGYQAGSGGIGTAITTGTYNTFIGYQANANANNLTNATAIGYQARVDASNKIVLGGIFNSGNETMVGIGTSNPASRLDVQEDLASGYAASFFNDGNVADRYGIKVQGGLDNGTGLTYYVRCFDGDGTEVGGLQNSAGTFTTYDISDKRLKKDIFDTKLNGLNIINKLRVVDFKRLDASNVHHGFIAQEVQKIFPYMVSENKDGFLAISKELLVPVLVKALQEQQQMIDGLNKENANFKLIIESLSSKMALIEKDLGNIKSTGTATGKK